VHLKVKDWKRGWTGESVMLKESAIKRGADAFTYLQAGQHDPEVIIIPSIGKACLMRASRPSPVVLCPQDTSAVQTDTLCRVLAIGFIFRLLETHSPTLSFSALLT